MLLEVRLFGGLREHAGGDRLSVELPEQASVGELRARLAADHPRLAALLPRTSVAVDLEVARDDLRLDGGEEVALLPPVAGGAGSPTIVTGLVEPPFEVDAVCAQVGGPSVGGTVSFLGSVRDHADDLDDVESLEYSAYPEMAEKVLAELGQAIADDHPHVTGIALLHAVGRLPVGAHTILVACASAHRAEAFDACRDALERVKDQVPVFKREIVAGGAHRWVGLPSPVEGGGTAHHGAADTSDGATDMHHGAATGKEQP